MQRCYDGLALAAHNVCRVVLVLIVRFHHVENHRLRLIAGGTPNSGEASLQVAGYCGIAHHVERPVDRQSGHDWQLKETPPEGRPAGLCLGRFLGAGDYLCRVVVATTRLAGIWFLAPRSPWPARMGRIAQPRIVQEGGPLEL
jgi:hypothetical protein